MWKSISPSSLKTINFINPDGNGGISVPDNEWGRKQLSEYKKRLKIKS